MGFFDIPKKIVKGAAKVVKGAVGVVKKVVRGVGKVFSKVMDKLPDIAKIVVMAVAAYFTFGVAMSYFPAMQGFVAAMPGFGAGGTFSGWATTLGVGNMSGVAAAGEAAGVGGYAAATGELGGHAQLAMAAEEGALTEGLVAESVPSTTTVGEGTLTNVKGDVLKTVPEADPGMLDKVKGGWNDMDFTDKLIVAKIGTDAISGAMAPTLEEQYEEQAKFRGAYFGVDGGGGGGGGGGFATTGAPSADYSFYTGQEPGTGYAPEPVLSSSAAPSFPRIGVDPGVQVAQPNMPRYG